MKRVKHNKRHEHTHKHTLGPFVHIYVCMAPTHMCPFVRIYVWHPLFTLMHVRYVNIFGCEEYSYLYCVKANPADCPGVPPMYWCENFDSDGDGVVEAGGTGTGAVIYWVSFVVVSALVMLSLFVGAVTMAMSESMAEMKIEQEEEETKERLLKKKKKMDEMAEKGQTASVEDFKEKDMSEMTIDERENHKNEHMMKNLLLEAWSGLVGTDLENR